MIARPEDTTQPTSALIPRGPCDAGESHGLLLKCHGGVVHRAAGNHARMRAYADAFWALQGDYEAHAEDILDQNQRAVLAAARRRERKPRPTVGDVFGGQFLGWYTRYHFAPRALSGAIALEPEVRALIPDVVVRVTRFLVARREAAGCETPAERRHRIAEARRGIPHAHRLLDALTAAVRPHLGARATAVGAHWVVGRITADAIWLEPHPGEDPVGPIALPAPTAKLCVEDWRIIGTVCTCPEAHFVDMSGVIPYGAE